MTAATQPTQAQACPTNQMSESSYALMTDDELEAHVSDCGTHMVRAYERFQETGNPHDRDEACMWLAKRDDALRAARWSPPCYFTEEGERARKRMEARG
jgi:hypothetical protein